jgi:hypothetical protein
MGGFPRAFATAIAATVAPLVAAGACGFAGEGSGEVPTGAASDATTSDALFADGMSPSGDGNLVDAPDPNDASTQLVFDDGGAEGGIDASACVPVPLDAFNSANWALLGDATLSGAQVRLTPKNMGGSAGALWWKTPITFTGRLHVVLDFTFALGTQQGDGITVAWIPTSKPYTVGPQGQSYGICNAGIQGSAVAVDTRDNQFVVVAPIASCDTTGVVTVSTLLSATKVTVDISAIGITASLDTGTTIKRNVTSPTTGYLGFTAATGNGYTSHVVAGVSALLCP